VASGGARTAASSPEFSEHRGETVVSNEHAIEELEAEQEDSNPEDELGDAIDTHPVTH